MGELKREWHSRKHEWKTYFQLRCFLACFSLLLKCVISQECAEIYPASEVYVKIGEPVELFCMTNGDFSADYLEFRWQGKVLDSTKVNDTAIKLITTPKPLRGKYTVTYSCKSNYVKCKKNTSKCIFVTVPPRKIKDFQCISDNFETLNCSWISPDDIETKYDVFYSDFRGMLQGQTDNIDNNTKRRYCLWSNETHPPYRWDEKKFTILINSSNKLGSATEIKNITDHFSIVKPAAVKNLSKVNVGPQHVELQWEVHDNLLRNYFGEYEFKIICDLIEKSNESKHIKTVQYYSNNLSSSNKVVAFNLTELPYAHMQYKIRVFMKPDRASEKFWSKPSEIYVNTSSVIPRRPPDIASGSFHQMIFDQHRLIKIYWKELEENEEAGANFSYNIRIYAHGMIEKSYRRTGGFLSLNNATKKDIKILIWSENEIGKSINASFLYIPSTTTLQVSSLTKHTFNNGTNKLSWKGLHNVDNYTIFWCPYKIKNNCRDPINYTIVGSHENIFFITLPRDTLYQFAISANYREATNGMTWNVCETYEGSSFPYFDVQFKPYSELAKTSVELHWSLNCILEKGYLHRYIIGYCPKGIPSNDCNGNEEFANSTEQRKLIHGLKPYTTYVFTIKLDTVSGIKSINVTNDILTLPDTPTSPRNICISTVLNDSLHISLDPPYPLNGDVSDIKYEIFLHSPNGDVGEIKYKIFNMTKKLDSSKTMSYINITVLNLNSSTNYSLSLRACNVKINSCSNNTDNIFVRTRIGKPWQLEIPTLNTIGSNKFTLKWKEPKMRGGNVDLYQIKLKKGSNEEILNITKKRDVEFKPCDEGVDNVGFQVRAVNNDSYPHYGALGDSDRVCLPKQNHDVFTLFYGEWSEERPVLCQRPADHTVLYLFVTVVPTTILLSYLLRKHHLRMQAKKDIYPIFAQGLFPSNTIPSTTVNENKSILNKIWLLLCKRAQVRVNQLNQQTSVDSNKPLMSQDNILEEHLITKSPMIFCIATECLNSNPNTQAPCEDVDLCKKNNTQLLPDSNTKPDSIIKNVTEIEYSEKIELHLSGNDTIEPETTNNKGSLLRNKFQFPKPIVNPKTGYVRSSFTNAPKNLKTTANTQTGYVQIGIVPEVAEPTISTISTLYESIAS